MVKRIISVVLVLVLIASFAGCGTKPATNQAQDSETPAASAPASETAPAKPKAVTLELYTHSYEPMVNVLKKMNEQYKQVSPNVTINYNVIPDDQFATKLPILFSSKQDVDIINLHSPYIPKYKEFLAKAPDFVVEDIKTNCPASYKLGLYDNATYGYLYPDIMIMLVNKTMYKEAGLEYPKTWDEMVKVNQAMTKKVNVNGQDVQKLGVNLWIAAGDYTNINVCYNQVHRGMGYDLLDADGKVAMNTPDAINSLNVFKQLVNRDDNMILSFAQGNTATIFGMRWVIPWLQANAVPGFEWEIAPLPAGADGIARPVSGLQMQTVTNYRPQDNQDAAWMYLQWIHNDENNYILDKEGGFGDWRTSTIERITKEDPILGQSFSQIDLAVQPVTIDESTSYERIFGEWIEKFIYDNATAEEALSNAQTQYVDALKK